jgi:hypothetical protein
MLAEAEQNIAENIDRSVNGDEPANAIYRRAATNL